MPVASTNVPAAAGIGLRFQHHRSVLETRPPVAWLEVHTDNYFGGGPSAHALDAVRMDYPVSLHGVGLSLGSAQGIDHGHLRKVRDAVRRFEPGLLSEHLSWSGVDGAWLPDLLPLPMTEEALEIICRNVDETQAALGRRILVENPSTYVQFAHSTIPEWEFLAAVARRTGCGILCDVNNIFISASNHGWNASAYLRELPSHAIGELHFAGHTVRQLADGVSLRIDDHGSHVASEVWDFYAEALELFGAVPTLIEWDNNVPAVVLLAEAAKAAARMSEADLVSAA